MKYCAPGVSVRGHMRVDVVRDNRSILEALARCAAELVGLRVKFTPARFEDAGLAVAPWQIPRVPRDEIGQVASSFNKMADNLQIRVRELAELNQNLGHEIGERERAEEVLRQTNDTLELRVIERGQQ